MFAIFGGVLGAIALFFGHLGYYGGPIYVDGAATAPTPPGLRNSVAVLMSGDLGFNIGIGPQVARRLRADGLPVVGVNSLTAFRHTRTPAQVQALVADAVRHALIFAHADRVILIGQSFGADMLHVGLTALPPALRARVRLIVLIVPGATVQFRASPSEVFTASAPAFDALPTARQLDWAPVLCVRGEKEDESLCPRITAPDVHTVALPGGHPLRRDADAVHRVVIAAIRASV
ncbi:AcvB/VirJ family lysyl-phosphatidylglycerol hydrolase [Sphingomonas sp.]|jgi:type IV secretory pathway VirJ component|uniref:AcvB/VirJ family lysyl-phosphatidylglycerol hydrolase n=1 Tax=Sphingomonas sp. TaxID=28214 RepID=UPI002ED94414